MFQVVTSAALLSSVSPSQSSSWPSQYSVAPGFVSASLSSQSVVSVTYPVGREQALVLFVASP